MVVTEALARGIPVLVSDAGGLPETLGRDPEGRVPGMVVPAGRVADLGAALHGWLADPDRRAGLRRSAQRRRGMLHGWEVTSRCVARCDRNSAGPNGWDARLSTPGSPVCTPDWLALREPADAAARDPELAALTAEGLGGERPLVIRDLGCGSGSLGRWLAPQLPGPQRWVLHDRDAELLARAEAGLPATAADGTPVTARIEQGDLTDLDAAQLAGTSLVAASALLDLLTAEEVDALADACTAAGCPALLTLSVTGSVGFFPAEPLDSVFGAAFDAHQRRTVVSESGAAACSGPTPARPPSTRSRSAAP